MRPSEGFLDNEGWGRVARVACCVALGEILVSTVRLVLQRKRKRRPTHLPVTALSRSPAFASTTSGLCVVSSSIYLLVRGKDRSVLYSKLCTHSNAPFLLLHAVEFQATYRRQLLLT
jgi:hypothetical protein